MKKVLERITLFCLVFFLVSSYAYADGNNIKINYFTTDACVSCAKTNKYVNSLIDELKKEDIEFELITYDILDKENEEMLVKYNNYFEIEEDKYKIIPAIFIGENYLIGSDNISNNLKELLIKLSKEDIEDINIENISKESIVNLSLFGVLLSGLMDGINPCSIAMMLFFISFVYMSKDKKNKILILGVCFSLGTFLAYLSIGIGLFNFINLFKNIKIIMKGFYILLFAMAIYLAILNALDYRNIKNGKEEKIKNQLSKKTKSKIHSLIKKKSTNKALYFTAFITAFLISFLEFFCTGQIYLPVITYMIKNTESLNYVILLVLYNLAFILPLLVITVLLHIGKEVIDISTVLVTKLHLIKLIGVFFFLLVAIYSIYQVFLI